MKKEVSSAPNSVSQVLSLKTTTIEVVYVVHM